jgi:hypothetical protein
LISWELSDQGFACRSVCPAKFWAQVRACFARLSTKPKTKKPSKDGFFVLHLQRTLQNGGLGFLLINRTSPGGLPD